MRPLAAHLDVSGFPHSRKNRRPHRGHAQNVCGVIGRSSAPECVHAPVPGATGARPQPLTRFRSDFSNGAKLRVRTRDAECSEPPPGAVPLNTTALIASYPLSIWLCFRTNLGAPANINARVSDLAESKSAALKRAHAAAGAAAGRHRAAKELFNGEVPVGQALERYKYRTQLRL